MNARIVLQDVQKWEVAVLIGSLDHIIKIANRLVIVQDQAQLNRGIHIAVNTSGDAGNRVAISASNRLAKDDGLSAPNTG
jgi:hypothetical protein